MARTTVPPQALTGVVAPTLITPTFIGQMYINTNDNTVYIAKGTSSSSDWVALN